MNVYLQQPPLPPALSTIFTYIFVKKYLFKLCENSLSCVVKVFRECERFVRVCSICVSALSAVCPLCVCFHRVSALSVCCAHKRLHLLNARAPASSPVHTPFRYPSAAPIPAPSEPALPPPSPGREGRPGDALTTSPGYKPRVTWEPSPELGRARGPVVRLRPKDTSALLELQGSKRPLE